MRQVIVCLLALTFVFTLAFSAQAQEIRKGEGRFAFEETVLENGLRVISLEDDSTPIVAVQLWYHVGSKDEKPGRQGFAHMFEHMMFRGTDRLGPEDHFEWVRRTGGNCNAYTSFDQTVYVQEAPANQLDMILWLEAERMARLKIDEGGFATERKVVEEERRLGLNQPYGTMLEQVLEFMFTKHPYNWSPIGKIAHLRAADVDDIQEFWDTYYVPNNATLVVVGDVKHADVRALAEKNFGWIPRCADPPRVTIVEPEQRELRKLDVEDESAPAPIAGIVFRTVPDGHPDALALEMLANIVGDGESSRLYLDLVRRKDVAEFAGGGALALEQAGMLILGGVTLPLGDVDDIVDAIWEVVNEVKENGVTEAELEKVRANFKRNSVTESLTVESKASALGTAAVIQGDAQLANTYLERVAAVTPEDLARVAKTYLVPRRANEVRVKASLKGMFSTVLSIASAADDSSAEDEPKQEIEAGRRAVAGGPKAAAERPESLPDTPPIAPPLDSDLALESVNKTLANGLKVVVIENHEVPYVSLGLQLRAGAFTDDPSRPGTASMATSMVTRGTLTKDAESLAAELERHAISLSANAGHDSASVSLSSTADQATRAARLLAEIVMLPAFDDDEFRTLRDQTLTGMQISEKTPAVMAERQFDAALWGSNHPYGRPAEGTSSDLRELDVDGLHDWWDAFVRPDTASLYVAGDILPEDAFALAERYLGDWEADGDAIDRPLPKWTAPDATRIKLVDKRGAIQSEIRAGHEGIMRKHPLYATSAVLTQVFGGAFTSRLNESLRIDKGLTYGASGGLQSRRFGGQFGVRTFTKTAKTAETVRALIEVVKNMHTEAPSDSELENAASYLAGSFAGSLETPQSVAGRLWSLELNDLPSDYWNGYLRRIAATTSEEVQTAAQQLLDPERMLIVVVGDAEKVKDELEEIAEVDVLTTDG
ncbi:MAG: peptidase M16 [Planctomycetota bacterium]|nr:MAG: peptidase M16 [Planctomycetota bacterium]